MRAVRLRTARRMANRHPGGAEGYGDARQFVQQAYPTPDPQRVRDPAEVVDAMVRLVEMPAGTRPLRTTVDNPLPQIEQINTFSEAMHHMLYPMIGLGHLLASASDAVSAHDTTTVDASR